MRARTTIWHVAVSQTHVSDSNVLLKTAAWLSTSFLALPFCRTNTLKGSTSPVSPVPRTVSQSSPSSEMDASPRVRNLGVIWSVLLPHHSPLPLLRAKPSGTSALSTFQFCLHPRHFSALPLPGPGPVCHRQLSPSLPRSAILPTLPLPRVLLYTEARGTFQSCRSDQASHHRVLNPPNSSPVLLKWWSLSLPLSNLILCVVPPPPPPPATIGMPQLPWFPSNTPSSSPITGLLTQNNCQLSTGRLFLRILQGWPQIFPHQRGLSAAFPWHHHLPYNTLCLSSLTEIWGHMFCCFSLFSDSGGKRYPNLVLSMFSMVFLWR